MMGELDYDLVLTIWSGFYPADITPAAVIDRIEAACCRMKTTPAILKSLSRMNMLIRDRARNNFVARHAVEYRPFGKPVQEFKIRTNQDGNAKAPDIAAGRHGSRR